MFRHKNFGRNLEPIKSMNLKKLINKFTPIVRFQKLMDCIDSILNKHQISKQKFHFILTRLSFDRRRSTSTSKIRYPSNLVSSNRNCMKIFSKAGSVTERKISSRYAIAAIWDALFVWKLLVPLKICNRISLDMLV